MEANSAIFWCFATFALQILLGFYKSVYNNCFFCGLRFSFPEKVSTFVSE